MHEIACGIHRDNALSEPYAWLVLCWPCNSGDFKDRSKWPEAKQLALKYLRDNLNYDLQKYLQLTNPRAMQRITQDEVDRYLTELTGGRHEREAGKLPGDPLLRNRDGHEKAGPTQV